MGFAAGFNAGSSAVQRGVANAIAYKKMKAKQDAEAEEKIAASNKAAKEVNAAAKKTAIEIVEKQSNLVNSINLSKSISEHTAHTKSYNSYQEEAAIMLNDASFNTQEAVSDIGRLDLSTREEFQSVEISDGKGGVVSVNIPSSLAREPEKLVLGIDDGKIYWKTYNPENGQEQPEFHTLANIPTVTFPKEEGSPNGYTIGIAGNMSPTELKYFKRQGIDPNKVSMTVLTAVRKNNLIEKKPTVYAQRKLDIEESSKLISNIYYGNTKIENLTKKDILKINIIERASNFKGLGEREKKLIIDSESTLASGKSLMTMLHKIGSEKINRGMFDAAKAKVQTWMSDGTWESMDKDEKEKALLTIAVNTKLGNALAKYIKSISGTAVAQAEYDRLVKIFTTGDFSNIQSLKESVGTFYADLQESHYTRLNDNLLGGGSFILSKMWNHNDRFKKEEPEKEEPETEETEKEEPEWLYKIINGVKMRAKNPNFKG